MKVEVQIDSNLNENKIIIKAKEMNNEISELIKKLSNQKEKITVLLGEETYFIKEDDIESVFSNDGKVFIQTEKQKFQSKSRLYELEEILSENKFIRISNSEIVNYENSVKISALTGEGIDVLLALTEKELSRNKRRVKLLFPFDKISASSIARAGTVHFEEYRADGLLLDVTADIADINKLKDYII